MDQNPTGKSFWPTLYVCMYYVCMHVCVYVFTIMSNPHIWRGDYTTRINTLFS